jgi:hypothetical protein
MITEGFCTAVFKSRAAKSEAKSGTKQENSAEKKELAVFYVWCFMPELLSNRNE